MSAKPTASNALYNSREGMVINPAGDWIELSREEVEQLANGKDEDKLTSR